MIAREIEELRDELVGIRRDLHRHPELGFEEHRTSNIICQYLSSCGIEAKRIAGTGVVGLLKGSGTGRTVLLRADMDALPIEEENEVSYKSTIKGKMHACGHDGHVAMLLVAAKILAKHRADIRGNIKFVFQPNEEDAGASIMINEGVMEDPAVDAAFSLHLWTPLKSGCIGIVPGPIMASSDYFRLTVIGKGGHGGAPCDSIDPVICAANIIQTTQMIQTREISALKPTLITFCKIHCGSTPIIIPEKVQLEGSIRCLYEGYEDTHRRFERVVKSTCDAHRTSYELEITRGNSLLTNDAQMTHLVRDVAADVVGRENIRSDVQVMLGDDFAEFGLRVPIAYYFVGTADTKKGTDYPHHHPRFNIDEDTLPIGVKMHVKTALRFLSS